MKILVAADIHGDLGMLSKFVESVDVSGSRLVLFDLVDEDQPWRHDSKKLAEAVKSIGDSYMN